ncbi:MAG: hypothetical protein QOJ79_2123 [Actinomycetota bacterium]|nr:hypothetical protein [Actinomycetota bacterium]
MTSAAGVPRTPPQRPPLSRGKKELLIALVALPPLLIVGIYLGGRISDRGSGSLQPAAAGIASPLVTVVASPSRALPSPVVTVKPAGPRPLVTVKPPAPSPVATVKPRRPSPVATVKPPAPGPVATVQPAAPRPPPSSPPSPALPPTGGPVAPAPPPPGPVAVLGRGSAGPDVRSWQRQMSRRGWSIRVDGVFGPQSEAVARRFQRNKGLRVDGLVGPQTWTAAWRLPVLR